MTKYSKALDGREPVENGYEDAVDRATWYTHTLLLAHPREPDFIFAFVGGRRGKSKNRANSRNPVTSNCLVPFQFNRTNHTTIERPGIAIESTITRAR